MKNALTCSYSFTPFVNEIHALQHICVAEIPLAHHKGARQEMMLACGMHTGDSSGTLLIDGSRAAFTSADAETPNVHTRARA